MNASASNFTSNLLPLPSLNATPPNPQSFGLLPNSTVTVLNLSTPASPNLTNSAPLFTASPNLSQNSTFPNNSAPLFPASPNLPQNGTFPNVSAPQPGLGNSSSFSNSSGLMNGSIPQNGPALNASTVIPSLSHPNTGYLNPSNSSTPLNKSALNFSTVQTPNQNLSIPSFAPTYPSINASALNGSNGSALNGSNLNGPNLNGSNFNGSSFNGFNFNGSNFNGSNGLNNSNSSNSSNSPAVIVPNANSLASPRFAFMNQTAYMNYLASSSASNASNSSASSTTPPLNSTSSAHPQNATQGPLLTTVSGSSSHHSNHASSAHNCPPGTHWFPEYEQCDFCPQGLTFNPK